MNELTPAQLQALPLPDAAAGDKEARGCVLVVGGSLGAQALNEIVPPALALIPESTRPQVTHQAGEKHIAQLEEAYRAAGVRAATTAQPGASRP